MSARSRFLPPAKVKPPPKPPKYPWLVPFAFTVAVVVLVAGIVWASLLGHLFS